MKTFRRAIGSQRIHIGFAQRGSEYECGSKVPGSTVGVFPGQLGAFQLCTRCVVNAIAAGTLVLK